VVALASAWLLAGPAHAATLPAGFQESVVFSGLVAPTNVRFASDGRVFVAQKNGVIKEFDSLSDTTPTIVADLSTQVDNYWDRGLLGLALDPSFPTNPYIYVLYTYDAPIGGTAPVWNDACPSPPGPTTDGCVVSGRLSKLTLSGNTATSEQVLIKDQWCQQYPSHSIGDLNFGPDGALYVSAGDGASFTFADYGQGGGSSGSPTPKNPCGDPPAGVGGSETPPTAEGGALRSQSLRRASGEPVLLNGAVLRVDPATGDALPDNPLASSSDPNARRIVAYGFRNPFRFTLQPLTTDLWVGDVGWSTWEEIDHAPSPTTTVQNFGWPCYEGASPQPGYQSAGLNLCSSLYSAGTATAPYFTYNHSAAVVSGDNCPTGGGSSITGLAFYSGGAYPAAYIGTLFFADYSRQCIWYMPVGGNGLPDPTQVRPFDVGASGPVDLEIGPNGDLFYADLTGGTIRRITYIGGNNPPSAVASASPTSGSAPLAVQFDGSGSSDPDAGDTISYSWDLNGDGTYGDSTAVSPSYTYSSAGTYTVRLQVTDSHGASTVSAPVTITVLSGGSATFGTTSPGASTDTASVDLKEVSKYTAPQAGSVFKLTGYVSGLGAASGSQPVRAVIYADSGGNPGALLAVSNAVTVTAGQAWGWVDFTFPSAVAVTAGTVWMGYIAGSVSDLTQLRFDSSAGELHYNLNPGGYAAGPSNPFGTPALSNKHYSLYASYTASSNTAPVPTISAPTPTLTWKVGDVISFSGSATDAEDGALPATSLTWTLIIHHCPNGTDCHLHYIQTWSGVATGSFSSPDHEYPSWLEFQLTATDSQGLSATTSVTLQPQTVDLTFQSVPSGLQLAVGSFGGAAPFTRTVIVGSANSISASSPQTLSGSDYVFSSWSDGGAQAHNIVAPATAATYTATFLLQGGGNSPPTAVATGSPTSGTAPLTVQFDGSGSSDPDVGDTITYSWDLNGDGTFGDSTAAKPTYTYSTPGTYNTSLKVTDSHGASTISSPITITVAFADTPPTAVASASPTSGIVPLAVSFDGSGSSDPDAGDTITYSWDLNGDGTFGDSTAAKPTYTYSTAGTYTVKLKVTDSAGLSSISSPITITATGTFGTSSPGSSTDAASANAKEVSKYTAPAAVKVLKLTGYISGLGSTSGSQPIRAVIYADSGGNPGALLGVSDEVTINAKRAWGWVDFTFATPVNVPAGKVWLGYFAGRKSNLVQLRFDSVGGDLRFNSNSYSSGPSNPFGTAKVSNQHYSLYATYLPQ
jgi:PKD repeat protein/glucose/arabinose dehydrogenase